jgi:hypothetical protein
MLVFPMSNATDATCIALRGLAEIADAAICHQQSQLNIAAYSELTISKSKSAIKFELFPLH